MSEVLGIIGPGTLGGSLAPWAAECGLEVRLLGRDADHAARALAALDLRWGVLVRKGRLTPEAHVHARSRLTAHGPEGLAGCTTVLEAIPEEPGRKADLWSSLAPALAPEVLCLTGSSALPVEALDRAAGLRGRLLGFHLFVPVRAMRIVELVVPEGRPSGLRARAEALARVLGLRVACVKDAPGYAAARMSLALGLEAMRLLEEGAASAEDLDALMRIGYGHPVGPLELSDRVGLGLRLVIADRLAAAFGPRFDAPALLRQRVSQGATGRAVGRGFLPWPEEDP